MQLGLVVGTATATVKHPTLTGWKLLVVQPLLVDGRSPDGDPQLVIDKFGAGRGERVIMTSDGKGTQELMKAKTAPVRWSVMGIADQ
jgi:ethanolamine utilization protein EutN